MLEGWRKFKITVFALWFTYFIYKIKAMLARLSNSLWYIDEFFYNRENGDLKFASPFQNFVWPRTTSRNGILILITKIVTCGAVLVFKFKWNPILLIWTWRKWNELTISRPWAWVCLDQIWCLTIIVALTMHVKRLVNHIAAGSKWSSIPLLPDLGGWAQLLVYFIGKTVHVVHFHPSRQLSIM